MTQEDPRVGGRDRESLVRCVADALKTPRLMPDIDPNDAVRAWLSGHSRPLQQNEALSPPRSGDET